jgi:hypothetical protein
MQPDQVEERPVYTYIHTSHITHHRERRTHTNTYTDTPLEDGAIFHVSAIAAQGPPKHAVVEVAVEMSLCGGVVLVLHGIEVA